MRPLSYVIAKLGVMIFFIIIKSNRLYLSRTQLLITGNGDQVCLGTETPAWSVAFGSNRRERCESRLLLKLRVGVIDCLSQ